jgi:hypothetical protein
MPGHGHGTVGHEPQQCIAHDPRLERTLSFDDSVVRGTDFEALAIPAGRTSHLVVDSAAGR